MPPPQVTQGSIADVVSNLHAVAGELRSIAAAWSLLPRLHLPVAQTKLLICIADELKTFGKDLRADTRLLAWRTRNVFELFLLLHKTSTEETAKVFAAQALTDEIGILEGLLGLVAPGDSRVQPARDEVQRLHATLSRYGTLKTKHWTISELARTAGHKAEYDAFFKVCSKYVHPSGWSVAAPVETLDSVEYQEIFIHTVQRYVHHSRGLAQETLLSATRRVK